MDNWQKMLFADGNGAIAEIKRIYNLYCLTVWVNKRSVYYYRVSFPTYRKARKQLASMSHNFRMM